MNELITIQAPNYVEPYKDDEEQLLKDFERARENLITVIEIGGRAAKELEALSKNSQLPGYYEVLNGLIKNLGDSPEKLLRTHEQIEKITKRSKPNLNVNNSVVYLSTAEISKAMKELENEES